MSIFSLPQSFSSHGTGVWAYLYTAGSIWERGCYCHYWGKCGRFSIFGYPFFCFCAPHYDTPDGVWSLKNIATLIHLSWGSRHVRSSSFSLPATVRQTLSLKWVSRCACYLGYDVRTCRNSFCESFHVADLELPDVIWAFANPSKIIGLVFQDYTQFG